MKEYYFEIPTKVAEDVKGFIEEGFRVHLFPDEDFDEWYCLKHKEKKFELYYFKKLPLPISIVCNFTDLKPEFLFEIREILISVIKDEDVVVFGFEKGKDDLSQKLDIESTKNLGIYLNTDVPPRFDKLLKKYKIGGVIKKKELEAFDIYRDVV
jgi:hypothetical protein